MFSLTILIILFKKAKVNKKILFYYITWQIVSVLILQYLIQNSSAESETFFLYILPTIIGSIYDISGGLVLITLGLIFYYTKENKKRLVILFITFDIIYFISTQTSIILNIIYKIDSITGIYTIGGGFTSLSDILIYIVEIVVGIPIMFHGASPFFINYQWMMILALPFIIFCNDKRIKISKYEKNFFYWFYPIHLFILHGLVRYILN